jgi:hypothetical protein
MKLDSLEMFYIVFAIYFAGILVYLLSNISDESLIKFAERIGL